MPTFWLMEVNRWGKPFSCNFESHNFQSHYKSFIASKTHTHNRVVLERTIIFDAQQLVSFHKYQCMAYITKPVHVTCFSNICIYIFMFEKWQLSLGQNINKTFCKIDEPSCFKQPTVNNIREKYLLVDIHANISRGTRYALVYSIRVPGWVLKCLNLITAPGSVSNQPGSVTWLATAGISKIHAVSWRNHIENLTTKGAQSM